MRRVFVCRANVKSPGLCHSILAFFFHSMMASSPAIPGGGFFSEKMFSNYSDNTSYFTDSGDSVTRYDGIVCLKMLVMMNAAPFALIMNF